MGTSAVADKVGVDEDVPTFLSCVVVRNKDTGACKGYCFLTFSSECEAAEAVVALSSDVEVAGCIVQVQPSRPKPKSVKEGPKEDLHDLRIRRQRFQPVSLQAQRGHATCSDKTKNFNRFT